MEHFFPASADTCGELQYIFSALSRAHNRQWGLFTGGGVYLLKPAGEEGAAWGVCKRRGPRTHSEFAPPPPRRTHKRPEKTLAATPRTTTISNSYESGN